MLSLVEIVQQPNTIVIVHRLIAIPSPHSTAQAPNHAMDSIGISPIPIFLFSTLSPALWCTTFIRLIIASLNQFSRYYRQAWENLHESASKNHNQLKRKETLDPPNLNRSRDNLENRARDLDR